MKKYGFIWALLFGFASISQAQTDSLGQELILGSDTLTMNWLDEVTVTALPDLTNYEDRRDYYILRRKVLKVWPYAKEAAEQLYAMEKELEGEDRQRKRKKYAKSIEKYLEENFKEELKKFTRSEGRVLVKLTNRETKRTTHELIKEYRGGLNAFFWQSVAKIYDNDLKSEYNPDEELEDAWIENILLRAFETGILERPVYE